MREKETRTRWFRYTAEDAKAAQAELDGWADRGWELEEVGLFTATFRKAEHPRRCWVEPARWSSEGKRDGAARADYLALCDEAGWELAGEDGGLFYFRAREGTHPAPVQTDGTVEWEDIWKKALSGQAWNLLYLVIYWGVWGGTRFLRDRPRVWELFLSDWLMAAQALLLVWASVTLFLGLRVIRYRRKCRRAAEYGEPFPVPRRGTARFRGALPLVSGALVAVTALCALMAAGEGRTHYLDGYAAYTEEQHSVLADSFTYRCFEESKGDLWVERVDCRTGWLAGMICGDLRATEGNEKRLDREFHQHGPAALREAELGFDRAWAYSDGEYSGLIIQNGDQIARLEANQLDLTAAETLADLRVWLAEGL